MPTLATALLQALKDHGAREIFGIPGDFVLPLGGHGLRVTTRREFIAAMDDAVNRRGQFSLIEVMLPRGLTSDTLARFISGFKKAREKKG